MRKYRRDSDGSDDESDRPGHGQCSATAKESSTQIEGQSLCVTISILCNFYCRYFLYLVNVITNAWLAIGK